MWGGGANLINHVYTLQNPDQAHLFESIYWEQYKKAMALSGVVPLSVALPLPPPDSTAVAAINMSAEVPPQAAIKQEPQLTSAPEQEYKTSASQNGIKEEEEEEAEEVQMEVDEPREEMMVVKCEIESGGTALEPGEFVPGQSSSATTTEGKRSNCSSSRDGDSNSMEQKNNTLMENEYNESRCSTGSNDDMWRPW